MGRLALAFGLTLGTWYGLKIVIDNALTECLVMIPIFGLVLLLTGVVSRAELRGLRAAVGTRREGAA
jgi:hypothetical protein